MAVIKLLAMKPSQPASVEISKTHHNDAFVIAGGGHIMIRRDTLNLERHRRGSAPQSNS